MSREKTNGQNLRNVFGRGVCSKMEVSTDTSFFVSYIYRKVMYGFRNFVKMTKNDFEILLQKLAPKSEE